MQRLREKRRAEANELSISHEAINDGLIEYNYTNITDLSNADKVVIEKVAKAFAVSVNYDSSDDYDNALSLVSDTEIDSSSERLPSMNDVSIDIKQ